MRLPLASALAAAAVLAAAATGATLDGTEGPDRLAGTPYADTLNGRGGPDQLHGLAGADTLNGGTGRDLVVGGAGPDRVAVAFDRAVDDVRCGAGRDTVNAELADRVAADCEVVSRQLSRDALPNADTQHETQVEPDTFANGSTIVAAYQVGRSATGGAAAIGFATSVDAGRTWRSGLLPNLTVHAAPAGEWALASDPVVAYDAAHGTWLIASLAIGGRGVELVVSPSRDGLAWGPPAVVAAPGREEYDKEWIVCDNGPASPLRGRCYVAYLDARTGEIRVRASTDGGATWSPSARAASSNARFIGQGSQPVVRPDGTLLIVFSRFDSLGDEGTIVAVRSTDGGATFSAPAVVGPLREPLIPGLRAPALPSAETDGGGGVHVAWSDCGQHLGCIGSDVVLSSSADGLTWASPVRVPTGDARSRADHVVPGLAVDPASVFPAVRLGLVYHVYRETGCGRACPAIDVGFVSSPDGGRTWTPPQRLNVEPVHMSWLADTRLGRMFGDYVSTSFVGGRPVPVFALASRPVGGRLRQAVFAATRLGSGPAALTPARAPGSRAARRRTRHTRRRRRAR